MNSAFSFDQKQRNTLKVSGLAAYVQRPPRDRVGWVHVEEVWLPGWRPAKWAWRVQHVEITFDSYCTVEDFEAQDLDFEPWDYLMVTAYEAFLTDDLREVETFFAHFVDRVEFAQHPRNVGFPDEFNAHERQADGDPVRWSLAQRKWVSLLLCLKGSKRLVIWQQPESRAEGRVTKVGLSGFELTTNEGPQWLSFFERDSVQLYTTHADGYIQNLWHELPPREALDPSTLPIWSRALDQWTWLEEAEGDG